jgi:methionyl-tRNA formyltransferase
MVDSAATPSLRIVFAGTPDFAAHHLQALLHSRHQVVAVYTQPDRPAGRGKKLTASPVKLLAAQHDLPIEQPENLKSIDQQKTLAAYQADVMVVVAYGVILPEIILATPRLGCINVHASLLPRWRGAAPVQRAILSGDAQTGVTIMQMDKGLDTGDILLQKVCAINDDDTGASLFETLAVLGQSALLDTLDHLVSLQQNKRSQHSAAATYAQKLHKEEGLIDWALPATEIDRRIRAFNPWPVAFGLLNGERVRLWKSKPLTNNYSAAGTIVAADEQGLIVACGKGALHILQLQLPGGKQLPFREMKNAHNELFKIGNCFKGVA